MHHTNAISLSELSTDNLAKISALNTGSREATRLVSLGFTPGAEVSMAQNYGYGPLIVTVRGTRIALGRVEAANILVKQTTR